MASLADEVESFYDNVTSLDILFGTKKWIDEGALELNCENGRTMTLFNAILERLEIGVQLRIITITPEETRPKFFMFISDKRFSESKVFQRVNQRNPGIDVSSW